MLFYCLGTETKVSFLALSTSFLAGCTAYGGYCRGVDKADFRRILPMGGLDMAEKIVAIIIGFVIFCFVFPMIFGIIALLLAMIGASISIAGPLAIIFFVGCAVYGWIKG